MKWLEKNGGRHLRADKPQVLFDYTFDAMEYFFSKEKFKQWLLLLSFLPQDSLSMPDKKGCAGNHVLLGIWAAPRCSTPPPPPPDSALRNDLDNVFRGSVA